MSACTHCDREKIARYCCNEDCDLGQMPLGEQDLTLELEDVTRERDEAVALIAQLRAEGQAAREALQQLERNDLVGPLYFTKVNDLRRTTRALLARLEGK